MARFKSSSSIKKVSLMGVALLILVGAIYGITRVVNSGNTDDVVSPILAEATVGTSYEISALGQSGEVEGNVKMELTKAEKTREVLVQGKPATAKGEKAFLVLNLEIENAETKPLYIAPVDLFRIIGDNGQKFAADVHSKLVEVQPISTKITRIGFVVDESQTVFNLQVGELDGEKENLQINF